MNKEQFKVRIEYNAQCVVDGKKCLRTTTVLAVFDSHDEAQAWANRQGPFIPVVSTKDEVV
jgi:hypothetical protein